MGRPPPGAPGILGGDVLPADGHSPEMGEQGYGFQLWMGKRPGSYLCNGI
mgnify:CR=1 FL=1